MNRANLSQAETETSFLKRIDLVVEGINYAFDDFAFKNCQLVLNNLFHKNVNKLLILHPTGAFLSILISTIIPIALAKHDIEQASRDITNHLSIGDRVKRDGCLGEVINITEIFERQYIVVKFNDLIESIPFERAWQLQKYEGNAVNLHNFNPKPNKKNNKRNVALCNILDIKEDKFPLALSSKTLIVSEKQFFIDNIEKVQLSGSLYSTVFPTGYFKDETQFERIGTDSLQRRPIVCVVSSLAIACEIIEKDPSIKGIIIHDLKKLKGNYSYLDRIQSKLTNIFLFQELNNFEEEDIEKLAHMGVKIFNWSYEKIKSLSLDFNSLMNYHSLVGRSKLALINIANPARESLVVGDEIADIIKQVKVELEKIRKADLESAYKIPFIARCYDGLMNLSAVPLPLKENIFGINSQMNFEKFLQDIKELQVNLSFSSNTETLKSIYLIVEKFENLIFAHTQYHPKNGVFTISDQLGTDDCIVVPKTKHKDIIEKWLANRRGNKHGIAVVTLTELSLANRFFHKALFTGWFGAKHAKILLNPMVEKQYFLLYPFEQELMDKNEAWISKYLSRFVSIEEKHIEITDYPLDYELEKYLYRVSETQQNYYQGIHLKYLDDNGSLVDCNFVEFEDDYYAFLTEGYKCRCIDKYGEILMKKKVSDLQPGDNLIFIKNSKEDIFEKLVDIVEKSNLTIREQVEISQLWRKALIRYKERNNYKHETIRRQLEVAGLKRATTTIKLWLYDENQIGPDDEGIRAIAKMTSDFELNSKLEQVIFSCSRIRALHVQLGRYLVQSISSAITKSHIANEDRILRKLTENLSQYAIAVSVRSIATERISIPASRVNILIDK